MQQNKINWYPGHMKKAHDDIKKRLNQVDFIIEVVDARAISLTSNSELIKLVSGKPILHIALKKDLSDINKLENNNVIIGSIKDKNFRNVIINKLNDLFKTKIEKNKNKGLVKYEFIGMVIGIPNIGKSSIINFLSNSKNLIVQNRAGVTKRQTTKKINDNYYLIDTPGILLKNIENIEDGYKLAIMNCINQNILPLYEVVKYHYLFLCERYWQNMKNYFLLNELLDFDHFLNYICIKYKYILPNNENDYDRALSWLFNLFSSSEVCKFHY